MTDWNVVAKIRVMPKEVEVDLEEVKKKVAGLLGGKAKLHTAEIKPIAFGLKALELAVLFNDKQGGMEEFQESISKIAGVGEVEVTDLNRL